MPYEVRERQVTKTKSMKRLKTVVLALIGAGLLGGGFYLISGWNVIVDTHIHVENSGVVGANVTTQPTNQVTTANQTPTLGTNIVSK